MSQADLVDAQKMMLKYRMQEQEMRNLKISLNFLTEKNRSISIDSTTQQNYQSFIDSFPDTVSKRDILLENLEEIAERKFEESNQTDMTANLCLYLIKRLRQVEELNLELQTQYIDTEYDPDFLSKSLKTDDEGDILPSKLKKLKPKYKALKTNVAKIDALIEEKQNALQYSKTKLETMRKEHSKSIKSIPETMRDLNFSLNALEKQIQINNRNLQKDETDFNRKSAKHSGRIQLISDIISELQLRTITSEKALPEKARILNELKLILENIISENHSLKFIRSRIILLVRALKNNNLKATTEQIQTPQPVKTSNPLLTALTANKDRIKMLGSTTPISTTRKSPNTPPQSFEDLKRKFQMLQQQANSTPKLSGKSISVKSPE